MLSSSFGIIVIHGHEIGAKGYVEKDRYALGERAGVGYDLVGWIVTLIALGANEIVRKGGRE